MRSSRRRRVKPRLPANAQIVPKRFLYMKAIRTNELLAGRVSTRDKVATKLTGQDPPYGPLASGSSNANTLPPPARGSNQR